MADPNTRQGKRTPVTLKIKFKSETLEQFIERYAVDVSQGGIFIRTKEPLAVGTQMKFEFQLRDASPLIGGEGTVVWTRENDPSRPAIAPGMGVRFDRLAEGSQGVLERILSEKAKQAPSRPSEITKPPMFTDTPTRVAPAPVQDALLGRSPSGRTRADSFSETSNTPLPRPVPFHSDADDFDERAFEEATKVRSLDELAAASANAQEGREHTEATRVAPPPRDDSAEATRVVPPSESQRILARNDATVSDPEPTPVPAVARTVSAQPQLARTTSGPRTPPPQTLSPVNTAAEPSAPTGIIDRDSAPGLPSPPAAEPRMLETSPSALASAGSGAVKTQLGLEMPRATTKEREAASPLVTPPKEAPSIRDAVTRPTGIQSVSSPKAEPARAASSQPMPTSRRPSSAPIIIGILVALAGIAAAVWYFVLRDTGTPAVANKPAPTGSDVASNAPPPPNPPPVTDNGSGSAVADNGSGSAAVQTPPTPPPTPAKDAVDTVIASNIEKATVEVVGESQSGPVPFTAKLEKGKAYKVKVSAPRYADKIVDVKGGDAKVVAKLDPKPATIHVESDPAGAQVFVDNAPTNVKTPGDITLTAAQAAKKVVHVQVRMAGKKPFDQVVETGSLADSGDKLTASVDAGKLAVMVVVQRPPPVDHNTPPPNGSDAPPPVDHSNDPPKDPTPPPTPPTPPAGGGEPEPDWTKKQ